MSKSNFFLEKKNLKEEIECFCIKEVVNTIALIILDMKRKGKGNG